MHERDLLIAAFEIEDPAARREYLDEACGGNPALRDRVERLLGRAAQTAGFLEQAANNLCSDFVEGLLVDASEPSHSISPNGGMSDAAMEVGKTLFGRYRVERELGSGGMGVVYLAEDLRLGRRVALKLPKFDADGELHLAERFRREARTMASVQHRNLCPIFDVDEQDGTHYLTMSFIDGEPLLQIIRQGTSLTTRQIVELIRKLALGLEAAHRAGVVHRDLKPANVMIDRDGEPILMDFGLAWLVHEADSRVTQTGAVIGTPAYMSPEQAEGDPDKVGAASDIYSLGVILYELIAGRPIRSGSVKQTLFKLMHEIPPRPSEVRSDVDPRLEEICCKAISRRPEDRFATAAELAEALASFNNSGIETLVEPRAGELRSGEGRGSADKTGVLPQDEITIAEPKPQVARRSKSRIALVSLLLIGVLGAVWATIGPQRKVETSKSIAAIPANPTTQTKPDVPARQAGDEQVEDPPRKIAPAKPNVPVDPGKPFVVVREGKDLRTFKNLMSAINEMQLGDTIEIRSNERFSILFAEPIMKPLAIRAGAGFRPWLEFVGNGTCDIKADFSVEGCDLDLRSSPFTSVNQKDTTWRFHRCRMWGDPNGAVSKLRVSESVIISIYGIIAPIDGTSTDYEFDNCLIRNNNSLMRYHSVGSHTLRLRNCTFYSVAGRHSRLAFFEKEAKLTVEAMGNVFHCLSQATELIEAQQLHQVTWIGADNCFSGRWYQIWEGNVLKANGLSEWNKLWKEPERNSREVDFLGFEWGRIQSLANPERFNAVRAASEKMIAEHKLPEVGPDWNLVGPGAAYVRALAAEGRAVPESELRPERREDGPIVLLRAGKEVRGYVTLKPALDAAQDKDVIELRTDGLVKDSNWTGDSRLLTIRAGTGYTPTIDFSLLSAGTDRLILEGLTIRHVLEASGGVGSSFVGDQPLYPTQGSLVRMMNCTLLGERGRSAVEAWMSGEGESLPEIVNCDISFLRIGLRSEGTARLRNSVLTECRPNVESRAAPPGTLKIDRCVFWLPELVFNYGAASLVSHSAITVQAHRSIFVSPVDLTWGHPPRSIDWTGTGNVFVKPLGFHSGKEPLQLERFQTEFQTEADSIELPPWEFDPAQWRILRDKSPGYQPRPDGTDYGANIDRLVNAIKPTADRLPADAPRPAIAPFNADKARDHQAAWAKQLDVPVEYTNSIGMRFVLIPPGEFTMGSPPAEIEEHLKEVSDDYGDASDLYKQWQDRIQSETPQHKVVLTKPVFLGIHEVTQRQYEMVMGTTPSHFSIMGPGREKVANRDTQNHPVESVSWTNAVEFCVKLSQTEKLKPFYSQTDEPVAPLEGNGYRLPTEAEWEFACRAGSTTKFWNVNSSESRIDVAWSSHSSDGRTHPVGELPPNPFGLFDVHGNVLEWVEDSWDKTYYQQFSEKAAINPICRTPGIARVIRGGSWGDRVIFCRAASRHAYHEPDGFPGLGFRVALTVEAVKESLKQDQKPKAELVKAIAPFNADKARDHQSAWAKHLDVPVEYANSLKMKFVLIPPGEFTMGSTPAEVEAALLEVGNTPDWRACIESEAPQHKVVLTKPFYFGVHEVTQAEYEQVLGPERNQSAFAPRGSGSSIVDGMETSKHPVERVSWADAIEFCAKLSQLEEAKLPALPAAATTRVLGERGYRLPTEAQWEFACRAGTTTKYWFGDSTEDLLPHGWFGLNSAARTHAVGKFPANPFGLRDLHGNVWEWVQDVWQPHDYDRFRDQPAIDPTGAAPRDSHHILRGGHWRSTALICRASARYAAPPDYPPQNCAGFRVVLDLDAVKAALKRR